MDNLVTFEKREVAGRTVVHVTGEVDISNNGELEQVVMDAATSGGDRRVVVDLSGVTFFDSSGVKALFDLVSRHVTLDVVAAPNSLARRTVDIACIGAVVALHDTCDAALE